VILFIIYHLILIIIFISEGTKFILVIYNIFNNDYHLKLTNEIINHQSIIHFIESQ